MQHSKVSTNRVEGNKAKGEYLRQMLTELRVISSRNDFDFLTYLIEMAVLEADDIAEGRMTEGRRETIVKPSKKKVEPDELANMFLRGELN